MRLTLALVVVLLAACGLGLYKLAQSAGAGEEQSALQTPTVPTTEETKETLPIQKSPITTIHIKAAGDLNVTDAVVNAGMAVNSYDFSPVFKVWQNLKYRISYQFGQFSMLIFSAYTKSHITEMD